MNVINGLKNMLINRASDIVKAISGSGKKLELVSIKKGTVYFTKSFCLIHKIKAGQYAHFLNEDKDWKFFINEDKDGFELIADNKNNGALVIFNSALTHLIRRSTGNQGSFRFKIEATRLEQSGKSVFMIMTQKPA